MIEKLLVDTAMWALAGFAEGLVRTFRVAGTEACEGELPHQWRLRPVSRGLLKVLLGLAVTATFEGDGAECGEGVVAELAGSDLQGLAGEVAGGGEIPSDLQLYQCELIRRHTSGQSTAIAVAVDSACQSARSQRSSGVAQ